MACVSTIPKASRLDIDPSGESGPALGAAPPYAADFRSDDLDEVREFIARYDGNHRRTAMGPGALGYSMRAVRCGGVDLGWMRTAVRQKVSGVPRGAILQLPMGKPHAYATRARGLEARPDTAVLLAPGQEYTIYTEPGDCLVALRLAASELTSELRHRAQSAAGPETREIPMSNGRHLALATVHRALIDAANPAVPRARQPGAGQLEARLVGWLADCLTETTSAFGTPTLAVRRVRLVEEWVDAHLATPITLGRLCAVAGVGDRWLESAFRAHRGRTPLEFVMGRRLAWVRRHLLEAKPGTSVTQLAHDAGFVHLGRFAARYRHAYGESPSQTLRHRLRRA